MIRVHDYIDAARDRPFRWGRHDCIIFAGGWIEARIGLRLVPSYQSLRDGRSLLADVSPRAVLDDALTSVPVLMSQTGDVVELPSDTGMPAFGIVCGGGNVAGFVGRRIGFVELTGAIRAWRVG